MIKTSEKKVFFDALDFEIPDGVALFAKAKFPELTSIQPPNTVSDAIIANGQFCANCNLILQTFTGLTLVDLILYSGARNPLLKALTLSCYDLLNQLQPESFDKIREMLARIQSIAGGLIGHIETATPSDLAACNQLRMRLEAQSTHPAIDEAQRGAIASTLSALADSIARIEAVINQEVDIFEQAVQDAWDASWDWLVECSNTALGAF